MEKQTFDWTEIKKQAEKHLQPSTDGCWKERVKLNPMISVIIPTYNQKAMLAEAVESVLMQTYKNVEILIIDDGSTDGTKDWFRETYYGNDKIQYARNEVKCHTGISRNRGFNQSKGDYLVFLDADDFYTDPGFFQKAIGVHQADDYAFVSANADQRNEENGTVKHQPLNRTGRVSREQFLRGFQQEVKKPLSTFTTLFKRTHLNRIGFETMRMMNDGPIYMRALLTGDPYFMEDFIGVCRKSKTDSSSDLDLDFLLKNLDEKVWVCKEAMEKEIPGIDYDWMVNETRATVNYYASNAKPNRDNRELMFQWVRDNLPKVETHMRLLVLKIQLKAILKNFLKKKQRA